MGGRPARRSAELDRRVWALLVVVLDKLGRQVIEVPRAHHDELVQAFVVNGLDEALNVGVEVWGAARQAHRRDVVRPQRIVERSPELGVAVPSEHAGLRCPAAGRGLEHRHLRCHPCGIRVLGARRRDRPSRGDVHEHGHVRVAETPLRHDPVPQEVARPQRLGVGLDELVPGGLAPLRAGRHPRIL